MFLTELNEKERKNFLELAHYAIGVDNIIDPKETNIFQNFKAELRLSDYQINNKPLADIIKDFNGSKKKIKKMVLLELWGVILADNKPNELEENLILRLANEWNLKEYEVNRARRWVEGFNDMLVEAYLFFEN